MLHDWTERFTDLDKLNLVMVVWFKAGFDFWYCPSGPKKNYASFRSGQKWHKNTFFASLPWSKSVTHTVGVWDKTVSTSTCWFEVTGEQKISNFFGGSQKFSFKNKIVGIEASFLEK